MDTTSDLDALSLKDLEELAYALQIDYDPPLQESDRKTAIEEIMWISDHRDEILSREEDIMKDRKRRRRRDGIMCDQEESVITGDNLLLLSDQQLIFVPFTHNGKKRYYCFTRLEAVEYLLKEKINPYTGEKLSSDDLDYIRNELTSKPYPNIPVTSFLVEIEERLGGKKLEYKKVAYRELIDRLVKIVEEKAGDFVKPGSLYDFASNLSTKNYNLFLRHDELRQVIDDNTTRDDAATETLNHIINRYNLLKTTNVERASNFIFNIALAMEEFLYMIKNNLSYQQLLEEKGEEVNDVKELHWKPDFLKEEYHYNGNLAKRYYVNEEGLKHGLYETYYENGGIRSVVNYFNGQKNGIFKMYHTNGNLSHVITYNNGIKEGLYEEYDDLGDLNIRVNNVKGKKNGILEKYNEEYITSRTNYVNDKKEGLHEEYYKDGSVMLTVNYINDKKEGKETQLNQKGVLVSDKEYKNGSLNGEYNIYYDDGNIESKLTYVNNKQEGPFIEYYENGNIQRKGTYYNGNLVGTLERYKENGQIKSIEEYDNEGKLAIETIYSKGKPMHLIKYKNGKLLLEGSLDDEGRYHGEYRSYNPKGELIEILTYKHGIKEGPFEEYLRTGEHRKGEYRNDVRVGLVETFYKNGSIKLVANYNEKGQYEGVAKGYYENGNIRSEVEYSNGLKNGKYNTYYEDGKPKVISNYIYDKRDGKYKEYDDIGTIKVEGNYSNGNIIGKYKVYVYGSPDLSAEYEYDNEGVILKSIEYEEGVPVSISEYKNGVMWLEYSLDEEGKYDGTYIEYYEDGEIKSETNYEHGIKID